MKDETLDSEARKLVLQNIPFAKKIARQFFRERLNLGLEMEELESVAMLGLCDAARRFDSSKGCNFQAFSYFRIRGAMYDFLRNGVGVSRAIFHSVIKANEEQQAKKKDKNDFPFVFAKNAVELAGMINVIDELAFQVSVNPDSGEAELTYREDRNPEFSALIGNARKYLMKIVDELPEIEAQVLRLYYFEDFTFQEMRGFFGGCTKSWICRLHKRALNRLQERIQQSESTREAHNEV